MFFTPTVSKEYNMRTLHKKMRTMSKDALRTGIAFFDEKYLVDRGSTTFIVGREGCGKTEICLQMAVNLTADNRNVLYVSDRESFMPAFVRFINMSSGAHTIEEMLQSMDIIKDGRMRFASLDEFSEENNSMLQDLYEGVDVVIMDCAFPVFPSEEETRQGCDFIWNLYAQGKAYVLTYPVADGNISIETLQSTELGESLVENADVIVAVDSAVSAQGGYAFTLLKE